MSRETLPLTQIKGRHSTKYRNRVLGYLSVLFVITLLDRICLSVAGPRMQADLHIGPVGWGWITGIFNLAYGLFEIPSGVLGDRIGSRKVLTRIVLWWSAFTALTGAVASFPILLIVRFCFGAGEAGAYPNASIAVNRWFPLRERARAFGFLLMSAQLGSGLTPLLVVPIQIHYGWRASFYCFGLLGVLWSIAWYAWFRDSPTEKSGISAAELDEIRDLPPNADHSMPWSIAIRSTNLWSICALAASYVYSLIFFQTWFHTYMIKGRGFHETDLFLTVLPYLVAGGGNLLGGILGSVIVARIGLTWGRRSLGIIGLGIAALAAVVLIYTKDRTVAVMALSLLYGGMTFQQPGVFAVCLDIGGKYAGATVGAMNTAGIFGGVFSSVIFGYLVSYYGNYTAPFIPMAALLVVGIFLWLKIDPTRQLVPEASSEAHPA